MNNIINVNNISYEYITEESTFKAIDNLNLDVKQGEFVAIIGHNGSGKSTLSKNLNAILMPTKGNILITTGSKEIAEFAPLCDRAFARVLPSEESLRLCLNAGFEPKRIICMQGPFSKEFNSALLRELDIKYLVTKRTGKSGGFLEKVEAARENNAECVIIERPVKENGVTVTEAEKLILEWL